MLELKRRYRGVSLAAAFALLAICVGSTTGRASDLRSLLSDATTGVARYGAHDSKGRTLDCLKIVRAGSRYLGVSHADEGGTFNVYLSSSTDLLHWTPIRRLDSNASQPTLARDHSGGWVFADEVTRSVGGNYLLFRHYASTRALKAGNSDARFKPPNTLAAPGGAQGTPNIYRVRLSPNLAHSRIRVGFHYHDGRDLQATGVLRNFSSWRARARPGLDARFVGANGNIGDRDFFTFRGTHYGIYEAQLRADDFGSWRLWLRDRSTGTIKRLDMTTSGGSTSFGNPTVTMLKLPNGAAGFVETAFLFGSGAAPGESGELIFYKRL